MNKTVAQGMIVTLMIMGHVSLLAQTDTVGCEQGQLADIFWRKKKEPAARKPAPGKSMFMIVPVLGATPATGAMFGAAAQQAIYLGTPDDTRISQASANVTFTTKQQFLFTVKSFYILSRNKFIIQGDWRYFNFSQSTFGLGTNAPKGLNPNINFFWEDQFSSGEQPMLYRYFKLHETIAVQVSPNIFLGAGYHLDRHLSIEDKNLTDSTTTSHYLYSVSKGFNPLRYTLSGLSFNFFYDSRDNQFNPYSGKYLNVQYRLNTVILGSTKPSSLLWVETRFYKNLSPLSPRHLIGWWTFAHFVTSGDVPYLDLPAYGYDFRNRSARSYIQGRFRGDDMVYTEFEYRFPISPCNAILGGVLFISATTLSDRTHNIALFEYTRLGYGAGLRVMVDKRSRTNVAIDVGVGKNSYGFTIGATETF